jgi:hypothetical protein
VADNLLVTLFLVQGIFHGLAGKPCAMSVCGKCASDEKYCGLQRKIFNFASWTNENIKERNI